MSRFNDYPDGANLLSDDLVVVSRQGRTYKLPGAALLGYGADADQFADFKQLTQYRLDSQTASINRLINYIEENGGVLPLPDNTVDTVLGDSSLPAIEVVGAMSLFDALDTRLTALGV